MSLLLRKINLRKNNPINLINSNSNKTIFLKKFLAKKIDESNVKNELPEKSFIKKNNNILNTSVKKNRYKKKININDYENKRTVTNNGNLNNNKSLLIKKNTSIKMRKKLDFENKENQRINHKEKIGNKKIQKKALKLVVNNAKIKIKQNSSNIKKNIKTQILNNEKSIKLLKLLNNIENNSEKEKNKIKTSARNSINSNKKEKIKEINININKSPNKTLMISHDQKNIIENGKSNEQEDEELEENKIINASHDDDLEYIFKYEGNKNSEKKQKFKTSFCPKKTRPFITVKKEYTKYGLKEKNENPGYQIIHRKINSEDNFLNDKNIKLYNSININEKENSKSNLNLINNFDIINIINKKEKYKQLFKSFQDNSYLNNSKEISEENSIKQYPTLEKKFQLNGLNIIYNGSKEEKEGKNEINYIAKTNRIITPINKGISLIYHKKNNKNKKNNNLKANKTTIEREIYNTNIIQNKRRKKYFVPIVSASLIKDKENSEKKLSLNEENLKNEKKEENIFEYNIFNTNSKNHINFGDNNKKKREILFNFRNNFITNYNLNNLSFRGNSFFKKRNLHINERNNSINHIMNDSDKINTNRDIDLDIQEKKLKLISTEISKYKFRKKLHNICSFSLDKISDKKNNNNGKNEENEEIKNENNNNNNENNYKNNNILKSNKINKKYKTLHLKLNPAINIIKNENNNFANGNKLVIKRGDLLNKLRKIKQNFNKVELSCIN